MDYWQLFWETGAPEWYVMERQEESCKVKNG